MGWSQSIGAFFSAIGSIVGFALERLKLKNTPEMKANANAARDLKEKEQIQGAIQKSEEKGDLDEERKLAAEE